MEIKKMSKLTVQQLYALGQHIVADPELHRKYYIGNQIRHLEYCAQRNKPELAEQYFTRTFGKTADQIIQEISTIQIERAKPKPAPIATDSVAVRIIDLSQQGKAPAPSPLALYAHACNGGCGVRLALPLGEIEANAKSCWCVNCLPKAQKRYDAGMALKASFVSKMAGVYYDHPQNDQIFNAEIQRRGLVNPTLGDLVEIFVERKKDMLLPLTPADLQAMSSTELEARTKIDPNLGGADLTKAREGQNRGEQIIHSTNETRLRPFVDEGVSGRKGWV
jgi:hypothetical protein